jgi:hypothetical protein
MDENILERLTRTRSTLVEFCNCDRKGFCGCCIGIADIDHIIDKLESLRDGLQAMLKPGAWGSR